MFTYQDFMAYGDDKAGAVAALIKKHKSSADVILAKIADEYNAQKNTTVMKFTKMILELDGKSAIDATSSNNRICSSFFRRFNVQRTNYSLGNGVYFVEDGIKESLGKSFDKEFKDAAYKALIHKVSFIFWNVDHIHVFPFTEFAPLFDEETGALRGGLRYWQIDNDKPMIAVLYEEDGYTKFKANKNGVDFKVAEEKRAYKIHLKQAPADAEPEIVGEENYSALPIIPLYGSELRQSTLVGMRGGIDAYDLIRSGYANDLEDCSQIYWIVTNAGGMDNKDLAAFRDRLRHTHIANVDNADDVSVTPYTQEVPFNSREAFLANIRNGLYEDFGALDVHAIAAGATNDHIDAAYQPLDDNADEFEYQLIECLQKLLALQGKECTPQFKRNRISNEAERTSMILSASEYLDEETILNKLPFLTPDEVEEIMERKADESVGQFDAGELDEMDDDGEAMFDDLEAELEDM